MKSIKMNLAYYLASIFIFALFIGDSNAENIYLNQKNPEGKLHAAIQLMSNRTIKRTTKLEELKEIFGDDLVMLQKIENERTLWIVRFDPPSKIHLPEDYASAFTGWYLMLEIDKHSKVIEYYLSNAHK